MAKTEKTTIRKSLLVDYFGDIIGEKGYKLSVVACVVVIRNGLYGNYRCVIDFAEMSRKLYFYTKH